MSHEDISKSSSVTAKEHESQSSAFTKLQALEVALPYVPSNPSSAKQASINTSTVRPPSERMLTASLVQYRMQQALEATAGALEERLKRMVCENGGYETQRFLDQAIQSTSFASHLSGECRTHGLCECQCTHDITPVVQNPSKTLKIVFRGERVPSVSLKRDVASTPNLRKELSIRLPMVKGGGNEVHSTKSDVSHKCVEYMADKTIKPIQNPTQNIGLIVDQDADYADCYLELLAKEQTGTQTELSDVESDTSYEFSEKVTKRAPRCTCFKNIEMPWDEITYNPTHKKPPQPGQAPTVKLESPSKPTAKLRELTVGVMDAKSLQELKRDLVSEVLEDDLTDENLKVTDYERIIINSKSKQKIEKDNVSQAASTSADPEKEQIKKDYHPPKRVETQVYEPACERHNEPYMDRMYAYFPDSCDEMDDCPSTVEMPWDTILVPKHCMIRKAYKPQKVLKKKPSEKSLTSKSSTSTKSSQKSVSSKRSKKSVRKKQSKSKKKKKASSKSILDITISFPQLTSKVFPVENSAKSQISISTTVSSVAHKPKRVHKSYGLRGCISQPLSGKAVSKKSSEDLKKKKSKCTCARSMPSISSKASVKSRSDDKNNSKAKSDRIAELLESCKKEMEPIKDGINKLRARIRELNLPDISSYQEYPQRPSNEGYPSGHFACIPSFASLTDPRYPLYMPSWPPYIPYMPPPPPPPMHPYYYCPGSIQTQTHSVSMKVSKSKSTKTKSSESYVLCSEGEDELFVDNRDLDKQSCSKSKQNVQNKTSRLSKPLDKKCVCKSTSKLNDSKINDAPNYERSCGTDELNIGEANSKVASGAKFKSCYNKTVQLIDNDMNAESDKCATSESEPQNYNSKSDTTTKTDTACSDAVKICRSTSTEDLKSKSCKCPPSQSQICPSSKNEKIIKCGNKRIVIEPHGGYFSDPTSASVSNLEPDESCSNTTCKTASSQKKGPGNVIRIDLCKVSKKNRDDTSERTVGRQNSTITIRRPYSRGLSITFSTTKTSAKKSDDPGGPSTE